MRRKAQTSTATAGGPDRANYGPAPKRRLENDGEDAWGTHGGRKEGVGEAPRVAKACRDQT
eukprot:2451705-Lingulodinium_polyedra.AAC.1